MRHSLKLTEYAEPATWETDTGSPSPSGYQPYRSRWSWRLRHEANLVRVARRCEGVSLAYESGKLVTLPCAYLCPRHQIATDLPWKMIWPRAS